MQTFQKNIDHFYRIMKANKRMNRGQFAKLIGVSRGTYFRMVKEDNPSVSYNTLENIVTAFNDQTGKTITIHDLMEVDLSKKYPLSDFYRLELHDDIKLQKLLKDLRKISYREVAKMSRELFKDNEEYQLTPTYVQRLESGHYKSPSLKKLQALATIYRVPVELFIADQKSPLSIQKVGKKLIIDLDKFSNLDTLEEKVRKLIRQESKVSPTPSIPRADSGKIATNTSPRNK